MKNSQSFKEKIAFYLDDLETPIGLSINLIILILILISLAIFITETYDIEESFDRWLKYLDFLIIGLFTIEYLVRFWCAKSKIKYFFSFFSLVDLLAIIPLFLGIMDIRYLRIFRWFRILRIMRIIEFKISVLKINTLNGLIFSRIILTLFSIILVYSGLIYQVEHQANSQTMKTFFDALYFSVVTMTTVGYGDIIPLSQQGRLVTLIMILTGVILIPWQIGELSKQLSKSSTTSEKICTKCGLAVHDFDANYCKICGSKLPCKLEQS